MFIRMSKWKVKIAQLDVILNGTVLGFVSKKFPSSVQVEDTQISDGNSISLPRWRVTKKSDLSTESTNNSVCYWVYLA